MPASPPPPPSSATVRRNPPRRARPPPTPARSATRPKPPPLSRLLDEAAVASTSAAAGSSSPLPPPPPTPSAADAGISPVFVPPPPTPTPAAVSSSSAPDERLKVYLRIRPLPAAAAAPAPERGGRPGGRPKAKEQQQPRRPPPKQAGAGDGVCLVATGPGSVALTVPQSKLLDGKRGRVATEVFDGFSAVLPPDSSQHDIFTQVMSPLVDEFLGGKSGLLVAMGPTGSGKTHTVFGTVRNPGIVPLTLHKIFSETDEINSGNQTTRSFCLSMFEILCEGKAERIVDLLSDAANLVLQQSTVIKGLKEVAIPNFMDADSLVARGMLKRSTAATDANSQSSRSQCIITIRAVHKNSDLQSKHPLGGPVLTIADLAGAERKKSTGNMGSRLLESNFINNTSMVFGNCLRALLDHQKKQKKTLEKHFKNSMLTRYLRDYLEGRRKMTLILNVKPGDDDYSDTSYLLRQASPYMKIRYTSLDDASDLAPQKRSSASLICQENKKKRKVQKPEVLMAEGNDKSDDAKLSARDDFLNSELQRVSRSEEIMKNLFRALWTFSKQKLLEYESAAKNMRELLSEKDIQITELKKELTDMKECSHEKFLVAEDTPVELKNDIHLSNELVADEVSEDFTCYDPERSPVYPGILERAVDCDTSVTSSIKRERASLSPHSSDRKAPVEQSEEELSSDIAVVEIQNDVDIKEMKHHDCPNSSQEANSDTEAPSCSQVFVELQGMGAVSKNPDEPESVSRRCEPTVEKTIAERDAVGGHRQAGVKDHADLSARVLDERPPQTKTSTAPVKGCRQAAEATAGDKENCPAAQVITADKKEKRQAGGIGTDKKEGREAAGVIAADDKKEEVDLCASSKPSQNTKKTRRRLLPVSSMLLKEFTGPYIIDAAIADPNRAAADGRSEKLIQLLKARPPTKLR